MENITILAVDDTCSELFLLTSHLKKWGYTVIAVSRGVAAIEALDTSPVDLIIADQVMPEMSGIELLRTVKARDQDLPVIILTAYASVDSAVMSIKQGADDYLTKPFNVDELHAVIKRSLDYHRLSRERQELQTYLGRFHGFQTIVIQTPRMRHALDLAAKVASSPETTVAIYGESGTGKELLARAIHNASGRLESRFVGINCAGIPSGLLESELFGHVKGAFTGADRDRAGKFGSAQDGTLMLDEIGDMSLDVQAKLLRVLQERTYEKVGSDKPINTNARIIPRFPSIFRLARRSLYKEDIA